jgi:ubiquinone/menaquinone biosynthesis C-methylase UbiE
LLEIHHIRNGAALRPAYEQIYSEQGILHSDSFYRWILGLMRTLPGRRFLDVACGQGRIVNLAADSGLEAYGMDLSAQAIEAGKGHNAHLAVANGQRLPYPDGHFHYLTNIGSLEHYVDPAQGVQEMERVLALDGLACILLPNTFSLSGNVLHAWHSGRTADDGQPIQRYAARYEWQDLLEAGSLAVIRTHKYESEPPKSLKDVIAYLRRPKAVVRLLLTPFVPLNLANSFVYICQKGINRQQ